jgi:uncharacterized repeat protein (TIGR03803 family)
MMVYSAATNEFMKIRQLVTVAVVLLLAAVVWATTKEQVLHNFAGGTDGNYPIWYGNLILDGKGNLYGTTSEGGICSICGSVFELSPDSGGWRKTTLYSFTGGSDGAQPDAGVVFDAAGNLYGTTVQGGCGTVFRLSPVSGGTWKETVLHTFTGGSDGCEPVAGVTLDKSGNVYGTASQSGPNGGGIVFELSQSSGIWTETILHSFASTSDDGQSPFAALATDKQGNLYGTTLYGGADGFGVVFELSQSGGVWSESVIYSFQYFNSDHDAAYPYAGVTLDGAGNLYGTTNYGGAGTACSPGSCGAVFELKHSSSGWTEQVLYSFKGDMDGSFPVAGVTLSGSSIYGATAFGGGGSCEVNGLTGCGTVFRLDQSKGKWVETVFRMNGTDGAMPQATLLLKNGNLFGTTLYGGTGPCTDNLPGCGAVFELAFPNFETSVSPTSTTVSPGQSATSVVKLTPAAGFNETVSLSCTVPSGQGLSCSVVPRSVTLDGTAPSSATLTVNTSDATLPGIHLVEVEGVSGALTRTATFTLKVQ